MSASLNIKDPEAHRLAQAISSETGEPMTRVVVEALREHLARLHRRRERATMKELLEISKRSARLVTVPYPSHGEELYDENGLPK